MEMQYEDNVVVTIQLLIILFAITGAISYNGNAL